MQAALNRAASLSHQLIDLARLEAEDFSVNKEQINIPTLISHITSSHVLMRLAKISILNYKVLIMFLLPPINLH